MSDKKKFGLVMPKKVDTLKTKISLIFNEESDDEECTKKRPKIPQKKMAQKSSIKMESDLDPSIYEYDSIYDEMKTKQAESTKPKEVKQSRYIETLLKAADKRKKEYERRIDRKIQIEREKEGDQFKDKEAFVTSSYKKKLQEKEEEEERERRENMLNDMMDVTKQKDLSGFYRHFLNQSIGEEKVPLFGEKEIKKEVESNDESTSNKINKSSELITAENLDQDSDGIEIDNEDDDSERDFSNNEKSDVKEKRKKSFKKRTAHYRERKKISQKHSSDANVSDNSEKPKLIKPDKICFRNSSIDSDSDQSSDDDEALDSDKNKNKRKRNKNKLNSRHDSSSSEDERDSKSVDLETQAKEEKQKREEKQRNIYAKRTVGDVFAEAQARYFQRMAMRNS